VAVGPELRAKEDMFELRAVGDLLQKEVNTTCSVSGKLGRQEKQRLTYPGTV
jgi:hypothetical protein